MVSPLTPQSYDQPRDVNAPQWQAITHRGSHLLIVAGPGTGKTHTLTYRIAHFIKDLKESSRILAITFTNKAAEEMRQRLKKRIDGCDSYMTIGTFHQICLHVLRKYRERAGLPEGFRVATSREIDMALKEALPGRKAKEYRKVRDQISSHKAVNFKNDCPDFVQDYNRILQKYQLLDFDDLLLNVYHLLKSQEDILREMRSQYPFIFVDEFQDVNAVQHALLKLLISRENFITVIGDPHQAIYGFRGADVRFFIDFQKDFPEAIVLSLSDNYRCAKNILSASDQVIAKIKSKNVPALTAQIYHEGKLSIHQAATDKAEAEYVVHNIEKMVGGVSMFSRDSQRVNYDDEGERSFGDIAVLYRLNSERLALVEAFERMGIPFQISGDRPLMERPGVMEIMTLWRLVWGLPVAPVLASRLLETVVDARNALQGIRVREFWGDKDIYFEDIVVLLDQERLFDDSTILMQLTQHIKDINAMQYLYQSSGYREVITSLPNFSLGEKILQANRSIKEDWQRLAHISGFFNDPGGLYDSLVLLRSEDVPRQAEKVSLMTMHASKGLEFAVVFIVGCEQNVIPLKLEGLLSDKEEERRLFYVAMTRAKERLVMTSAKKRFLYGKEWLHPPSEFINDITEELKSFDQPVRKKRQHKQDDQQMGLF